MKRTVAQWNKVRAKIKKDFERQGITFCEVCGSTFNLSFMHRLKRRKITTEEELAYVALACIPCHQQIEVLPAEEMFSRVTNLVERRNGTIEQNK